MKIIHFGGFIALLTLFCGYSAAETVVITNNYSWATPVRDSQGIFPDSLCFDSDAEEITFPDLGCFVKLGDYKFPKLRKVTLGNVDYMPGGSFYDMPELEEIIINGMVGHFDCTFVGHCPKLRKVVFNGPISSTGGPGFTYMCPQLDSVVFESVVCDLDLGLHPENGSPRLKEYIVNGAVLKAYNDSLTPVTDIMGIKGNDRLKSDMGKLAKWQAEVLTARTVEEGWMRKIVYDDARLLYPVLVELGSSEAGLLKDAMDYAWNLGDDVKDNLDILKESPLYAADSVGQRYRFTYVSPRDPMLEAVRSEFNLDSVAGSGDDVSRIKNLLYWIHDNIRHDGSNGFPSGPLTLSNMYYSSRRDSCGYNCRALAIALTEALLAEGIPARYVTCQSKKWDSDDDCHVICVAWSGSLNKWIWVDPTYAAYITDENGLLLHPGEVRYRLQNDMPLTLNPDANWNHKYTEDKEHYLDYYMAKNLYILSANSINQPEPEGQSDRRQGYHVALVPQGSNYTDAYVISTDDDQFWQSPE